MTTANPRDARAAAGIATERLASAKRVAEAVAAYHAAADTIDAAEAQLAESRATRNAAVSVLRSEGLPLAVIRDLTGLATSTIRDLSVAGSPPD